MHYCAEDFQPGNSDDESWGCDQDSESDYTENEVWDEVCDFDFQCGWNGCQAKYDTLNLLNNHVIMMEHGKKRKF